MCIRPIAWFVSAWLAGGCYASHQRPTPAPIPADGGQGNDPGPPPARDAGISETPDAFVGDPAIDESLTCENGPARWASECPDAAVIYVSATGSDGAAGTASEPMATLSAALARCATAACHLRIEVGRFTLSSLSGQCLYVEGGLSRDASGAWTHVVGATSELVGGGHNDGVISSGGALMISGLSISGVVTAISVSGAHFLVVTNVSVDASYSAVNVEWSSTRARLCHSHFVGGYTGVDISWSSSDVVIDDVDADGGYSGIGVSWSSHGVRIDDSTVSGGYSGLDVGQGAYDVLEKDSSITTRGDYHDSGP